MTHQLVMSLGTNYQREASLRQAFEALDRYFDHLELSPVYESQALGQEEAVNYYNVVAACSTQRSLLDAVSILKNIESECGRDRRQSFVSMDIDLLLFDDYVGEVVGENHHFILPRADILSCAYVLRPLADIYPDKCHPVSQITYKSMWESFCAQADHEPVVEPIDFVWRGQLISMAPQCLLM